MLYLHSGSCHVLMADLKWTNELDQGHNLDTVYLDFSKAFDSVPRNRLLVKKETMEFQGKYLDGANISCQIADKEL